MRDNDNEDNEFERRLAEFAPRPSRINRDALLFRAGEQTATARARQARQTAWYWPLSTIAMTILSIVLGWQVLLNRTTSHVVEHIPVELQATEISAESSAHPAVADDSETSPASSTLHDNYLQRRELALRLGIDAVSNPISLHRASIDGVSSYRELRAVYSDSSHAALSRIESSRAADDEELEPEMSTDELDSGDTL